MHDDVMHVRGRLNLASRFAPFAERLATQLLFADAVSPKPTIIEFHKNVKPQSKIWVQILPASIWQAQFSHREKTQGRDILVLTHNHGTPKTMCAMTKATPTITTINVI